MPGFTVYDGLRLIGKTQPAELEQMVLNSARRDRAETPGENQNHRFAQCELKHVGACSAPRAIRIPISFVRRA